MIATTAASFANTASLLSTKNNVPTEIGGESSTPPPPPPTRP